MSQQKHEEWGGSGSRPTSLKTSSCRSCGAQIHWIETTKGKNMPCNLLLREWPVGENRFVIKPNGEVWNTENARMPITGYESHFATCLDSSKSRQKGGRSDGTPI